MCIPPSTNTPPFLRAFSAAGTISPAGAKTIAASSFFGGWSNVPPAQAAPNPGAKQGRGLLVGKPLGNGIYKAFWRDEGLGIAAVHAVAGELRAIAQIFLARPAVLAGPVGFVQPGNSHTRTDGKSSRVFA